MNNERVKQLTNGMDLKPGAPKELLTRTQEELGVSLPKDYADFMARHNGGNGWLRNSLLVLWPLEEVVEANRTLRVDEFAPGLVFFGGDGGEMGYAFDMQSNPPRIVEVDYLSMGKDEYTTICGQSFIEFLKFLYNRKE